MVRGFAVTSALVILSQDAQAEMADVHLQCFDFPSSWTGSFEERCKRADAQQDGHRYIFNKGRGTNDAACGLADCWCCRCLEGNCPEPELDLRCFDYPSSWTGSLQDRCRQADNQDDGYDYFYNAHRGTDAAECGVNADCWCCRRKADKRKNLKCYDFPSSWTGSMKDKCQRADHERVDGFRYVFNDGRGLASAACGGSASKTCDCCRCKGDECPGIVDYSSSLQLPSGDIWAYDFVGFGDGNLLHRGAVSTDAGLTWQEKKFWHADLARVSVIAKDGQSLRFYKVAARSGSTATGRAVTIHRSGFREVLDSQDFELRGLPGWTGSKMPDTRACGSVRMPDGTAVITVMTEDAVNVHKRLMAFRSADDLHFDFAGVIAEGGDAMLSGEGPNENAMVLLKDNRTLMSIFRRDAGDGKHGYQSYAQTFSRDGGKTWSLPRAMPRGVGCAKPNLARSASGEIFLAGGGSAASSYQKRDVKLWHNEAGDGYAWVQRSVVGPPSTAYTSILFTDASSGRLFYPVGSDTYMLPFDLKSEHDALMLV